MSAALEIIDDSGLLAPEETGLARAAVSAVFERFAPAVPVFVCLSIVADERMREINRDNRQIDRTTDVLSFPALRFRSPGDGARLARAPRDPEARAVDAGELVISAPMARAQAEEFGHTVARELSYLCVHGCLHLLGFDHEREEDRALMRQNEEQVLARLGQLREKDVTDSVNELLARARNARAHSYSPYSRFAVGAALLAVSGNIYIGVNVENASYGLTCCAERNAVFTAVGAGERSFTDIAVFADAPPLPCGACLQVLCEFAPDIRVHVSTPEGSRTYVLSELLPHSFTLK